MSRQGKRGAREAKSRPAGDPESRDSSVRKDRYSREPRREKEEDEGEEVKSREFRKERRPKDRPRYGGGGGEKEEDDGDDVKERPRGNRHARGQQDDDNDTEESPARRSRGDKKAMPPIFKAIAEDDLAEVEAELNQLAPTSIPPIFKGCSPLSFAAKLGSVKMVKFLLQKGAAVDGGDFVSMTPLHHAVRNKHEDVVVVLLSQGANVRALSRQGKTPWEYARDDEMKAILRQHGSKSLQSPKSPSAASSHSSGRRRSFDGRDDRSHRSESWSGPRHKPNSSRGDRGERESGRGGRGGGEPSSKHSLPERRGEGGERDERRDERGAGAGDERRGGGDHRREFYSGHRNERSESRARRERQRKKKGEPRKPRPEGKRKPDSDLDDESGGLNDSIVIPDAEEDKDAKGAKGPQSPKTAESLENELLALLKEEQEQVVKMENKIVELKAEIQKVTGQLKTYKLSVSEKKKFLLKGIASLKAAAAAPPPQPTSPPALKRAPSNGASECVICLENTANCLIAPCGHICLCTECKTTSQPKSCPICRGDIQGIFQAFRV